MRDNIHGGITSSSVFGCSLGTVKFEVGLKLGDSCLTNGGADITSLLARSLHPWMKLPGSVNIVASPRLFAVIISRFPTVTGTGGTPLRDARTGVPQSVRCGVQIDVSKLPAQNFALSGI